MKKSTIEACLKFNKIFWRILLAIYIIFELYINIMGISYICLDDGLSDTTFLREYIGLVVIPTIVLIGTKIHLYVDTKDLRNDLKEIED